MELHAERREVEVRLGLDELIEVDQVGLKRASYRKRAATRIIAIERHGEAFLDLPEIGDPWCDLTVRARLERMNEAYNRRPRVTPGRERSCMPTPVRGWGDAAKTKEEREHVKDRDAEDSDFNAADQIVDVLADHERPVAWAIATRMKDRVLGRKLGVHHATAAKRKQEMLTHLAIRWNRLGFRPDAEDVRRARRFVHREV